MLYLLDANVLIDANNFYYPIDRVPEFWDWILANAANNLIKMPVEIVEEVSNGRKDDELVMWIKDKDNRGVLQFDEEVDLLLVQQVVDDGYADDLKDDEVGQLGRDPFLIAYALLKPGDRCVVTTETSKPSWKRQNRKIPDVCNTLGVPCCNTFDLNRELGFSTFWRVGG